MKPWPLVPRLQLRRSGLWIRLFSDQVSGILAVDGVVGCLEELACAIGLKESLATSVLAELLDHVRDLQRHAARCMVHRLFLLYFTTVPILLLLLRAAEPFRYPPEPADPLHHLADDFVHLGLPKVRPQFLGLLLRCPRTAGANHHLAIFEAELAAYYSLIARHSVRSFGVGLALRRLRVQVWAL